LTLRLSAKEARWLAIGAQHLGRPRPRRRAGATAAELEDIVDHLRIVQLDAVNVVERTQFLVFFSRLGPYDRCLLDAMTAPGGPLWEYWGHAASLMPVCDEPLLRWRYTDGGRSVPGPKVRARLEAWEAETSSYLASVMEEVRDRGPLAAGALADPRRRAGEWWNRRSEGRQALVWLHGTGKLSTWRTPSFESVYDLPERVLPAEVLASPAPTVSEAQRTLLANAARASGVGTLRDLAGYYVIQLRAAAPLVDDMVSSGELLEVEVEGWREIAYMPSDGVPRRPTRMTATLLSPFDSLVWDRDRTRRIFNFDYRIEIYVPRPQRIYGYYVLPVLIEDALVARVDLKADRRSSTLRVLGAFAEHGSDVRSIAPSLALELEALRVWLALATISVTNHGDLATELGAALEGAPPT
jgi:uncharacterized protein